MKCSLQSCLCIRLKYMPIIYITIALSIISRTCLISGSCCWVLYQVGSGYTRKELYDFNSRIGKNWQPFSKKNPPPWLKLATGLKQRPDCYIEPSKSAILQVQ